MPNLGLGRQIDEAHKWCFEIALPFWAGRGFDAQGRVRESLDFQGHDSGARYVRTRVVCRQLYVFSHAYHLGWAKGRALATTALNHLLAACWQSDDEVWVRSTDRAGLPIDKTPDLYDTAFVLFSLNWYGYAVDRPAVEPWIEKTLDLLEARFAHSSGWGYHHELPAKGPRLQNPHMHLLEACLVDAATRGSPRQTELAVRLVELFRKKLFDLASGTLAEYFTDHWTRQPGDLGRIVEPGHQLEWAWILGAAQKPLQLDLSKEMRALHGFAERCGVDSATGVVFNQVRDDGTPLDQGTRTWPSTERLKGALALFEHLQDDTRAAASQSLDRLLSVHLATDPLGLWRDAYNAEGLMCAPNVPTSTFYHVFLAFAELFRLRPRLLAP